MDNCDGAPMVESGNASSHGSGGLSPPSSPGPFESSVIWTAIAEQRHIASESQASAPGVFVSKE